MLYRHDAHNHIYIKQDKYNIYLFITKVVQQ